MDTRKLYEEMQRFASRSGLRIYETFRALIDYMSGWLDWTGHPVAGWCYGEKENQVFKELTATACELISRG